MRTQKECIDGTILLRWLCRWLPSVLSQEFRLKSLLHLFDSTLLINWLSVVRRKERRDETLTKLIEEVQWQTNEYWKDSPQNVGNWFAIIYLIRDFPQNVKKKQTKPNNPSTIQKQITQFINDQRIWIDISLRKIHKWPISLWEVAQHHYLLGNADQNNNEILHHTHGRDL